MNCKDSCEGIRQVDRIPANLMLTREIDLRVKSYAGFASSKGNHMFCWFFESQRCMADDAPGSFPLLIWLNGGPGASSSLGLMMENGPYLMNSANTLVENSYSWNQEVHIMYWDNPVGAGYSYNENGQYVDSEEEVGENFYDALQVFFDSYPQYRACPLYITGESYGGKYIPAIATQIMKMNEDHRRNNENEKIIKLKGLAIGNPWMSAALQTKFRIECGFMLGFIDTEQHKLLDGQCEQLVEYINGEDWSKAFNLNQTIKNELIACGGNVAIYDVRTWDDEDKVFTLVEDYFRLGAVKKALHVPEDTPWMFADETGPVTDNLIEDFVSDTIGYLPPLLDHKDDNGEAAYRMLLYTGNLDMSCGFRGTEHILYYLDWEHKDDWQKLHRAVWAEPGRTLGFYKSYANLTQIVVPCSGHMVPSNQPEVSLMMINNWVFGREFPTYQPLPLTS